MENTNTQITDNDFLLELEGLIDTPETEYAINTEINLNEKIEIFPTENSDNVFSEIHGEMINTPEEKIISAQEVQETEQQLSIDMLIEKDSSIHTSENRKEKSKIVSGIFFWLRYMLTTSLIFWVLLVTMNYQAYYNIAMSYINAEDLQNQSRGLISSVEASNITKKFKEEIVQQKSFIEEDREEIKSKNSVKNLLEISEKNWVGVNIEITPYQNRIVIPKIGKNIPLVNIKNRALDNANELNNIFMKELEKWVIRYPGSAEPGKEWNAFVFGHSSNFPWIKWDYNDVFALLDNVSFDDEILVYYNQKKYRYVVREKNVITPGDVSVLERNKKKSEITLMTCWPIGTTLNRLIVTGELVEEIK